MIRRLEGRLGRGDCVNDESKLKKATFGTGLLKGLGITMRHMVSKAVTVQYPDEIAPLPPRSRGVIALKEENCTMCMLCARECPDWCIYIEGHKERRESRGEGKRAKAFNVLDRFAIDYALCMYCGICVEVCPYDALFWSPEFEYAEGDIYVAGRVVRATGTGGASGTAEGVRGGDRQGLRPPGRRGQGQGCRDAGQEGHGGGRGTARGGGGGGRPRRPSACTAGDRA